jgi:hypothetical protein
MHAAFRHCEKAGVSTCKYIVPGELRLLAHARVYTVCATRANGVSVGCRSLQRAVQLGRDGVCEAVFLQVRRLTDTRHARVTPTGEHTTPRPHDSEREEPTFKHL